MDRLVKLNRKYRCDVFQISDGELLIRIPGVKYDES